MLQVETRSDEWSTGYCILQLHPLFSSRRNYNFNISNLAWKDSITVHIVDVRHMFRVFMTIVHVSVALKQLRRRTETHTNPSFFPT